MVFRGTLAFMIAFLFALFPQNISAQQKIPIELKTIANDIAGKRLVNRIKKDIQRSATVELTISTNLPRLKLTIVTLDPYNTRESTIYSLLMVACGIYFNDIFISSGVGVCGLGKINDVSQKMIEDINKNTELFLKAKNDWDSYGEVLGNEKQKLIEQVKDLQNKANELEEQLKAEKTKSWWQKLTETIRRRFFLSRPDLSPRTDQQARLN
jgi:hypothetical protein